LLIAEWQLPDPPTASQCGGQACHAGGMVLAGHRAEAKPEVLKAADQ